MNYLASYSVNNESKWKDAAMLLLFIALVLLYPFFHVVYFIRRQYWLRTRGYWVNRKGRDNVEYEERRRDKVERLIIGGELMAVGPHVIYVPSEEEWKKEAPEWAQSRREEILERVRDALGSKNYEYVYPESDA